MLLFFLRKVVVFNVVAVIKNRHTERFGWYEHLFGYSIFQFVGKGGVAGFAAEKLVGILVGLGLWGGGKANFNAIEIGENGPVAVVNAAVNLVENNEVEVAGAIMAVIALPNIIYFIDNGLVGFEKIE